MSKFFYMISLMLLAVILCSIGVAAESSTPTIIAEGIYGDDLDIVTWQLDDEGKLVFGGTGYMGGGNIPWYQYKGMISTVVIGAGVNSIGDYAFSECINLTNVEISSSVEQIGRYAFNNCASLVSVEIPTSVTYIMEYAFYGCHSLTSLEIPSGMEYIGERAFAGCTGLKSVLIQQGVTGISRSMFSGCSSLMSIGLPSGLTSIGDYAFEGCSSLISIDFPSGLTSIGDYAFEGCSSLMSIEIPSGMTSIGDYMFYNCTSLTSIEIMSGSMNISEGMFENCASLMSIDLPSGLTSIARYAFYGCDSLLRMLIPDTVQSIAGTPIPSRTLIYCYRYSYADGWAKDNGRSICYLDDIDPTQLINISLPQNTEIACGQTLTLKPGFFPNGNYNVSWESLNSSVVSVTQSGVLTAISAGTTTVIVSYGDKTASTTAYCYVPVESVTLPESEKWISVSDTYQLQPILSPVSASEEITYASSDTVIATVDGEGLINPKTIGDVVITATTAKTGHKASVMLHVCYPVQAVSFTETAVTVAPGEAVQLTANAQARNGTVYPNHFVTFTSSAPAVATVSENGVLRGVSAGITEITATLTNGVTAVCSVTVTYEGHIHTPVDVAAVPATCMGAGFTAGTRCSRCGLILSGLEVDQIKDHTPVEDEALAPTCLVPGHTEGTHCEICGTILTGNAEIPASGHKPVSDGYIAPTLSTWGCSAGTHCDVCGTIIAEQQTIPPLPNGEIVAIPGAVIGIAEETYMNTAVVVVRLPSGCTEIGAKAFANCTSLKLIEIPASVTMIASDAFDNCQDFVIVTTSGSTASVYATQHRIKFLTVF